ncbi:hypothetical protein FHX08_000751 [Rhizobium sp. BK529]|uniref:hypothetical protein n=1 Tax=unclassified Rhizobium TaxID=2613769 RepID=UPI00140537C5|nr:MULTISPECIES: hypothetical protein [unclassified Rhizobium]MBB3590407.1 hypothetical protein [Rhizobium sp. BK529]
MIQIKLASDIRGAQRCSLDQGGLGAIEEAAKAFSRVVASRFDAYLVRAKGRHSIAV